MFLFSSVQHKTSVEANLAIIQYVEDKLDKDKLKICFHYLTKIQKL